MKFQAEKMLQFSRNEIAQKLSSQRSKEKCFNNSQFARLKLPGRFLCREGGGGGCKGMIFETFFGRKFKRFIKLVFFKEMQICFYNLKKYTSRSKLALFSVTL